MKKALGMLVQAIVFLLIFAVFSFVKPFGVHWMVTHPGPTVTRYFVADGFLMATGLFLLTLAAEAASRRLVRLGGLTAIAYGLAVLIGFAAKLGFVTHDALL